jgi:3'-phosphoadenosine 5'-phosphosulfate sulfotransferase (PAPS reductase)/FAD synthetase
MKNYLSFGGGVNSTAMLIMLHEQGLEFESIYVDHGCDWPETLDYIAMIQTHYPITILKPDVEGFDNLYDYCWRYEMVPFFSMRFCTAKFKVRVIQKYVETPCFQYLGIASDEAHRAKLKGFKGAENRFPLIENNIDREGCKKIITDHGFPVPRKSGCWFCMFQRVGEWRELREKHPDLFCKAQKLEARNNEYRKRNGKGFMGLIGGKKALSEVVNERQRKVFEEDEYPPCNCGL